MKWSDYLPVVYSLAAIALVVIVAYSVFSARRERRRGRGPE